MAGTVLDIAPCRPPVSVEVRVIASLRWFAYAASISACSGAVLFCYWNQLGRTRAAVSLLHQISSDATLLLLVVYLVNHLRRVWWQRQTRRVTWWSGIVATAAWVVSGAAGVYGQLLPLRDTSAVWWIHVVGSFGAFVFVCCHAAHGFRAQFLQWKGNR